MESSALITEDLSYQTLLHKMAIALGILWLFDGLLQLQPSQFSNALMVQIQSNAMAQPHIIAHLEILAGEMIGQNLAFWNLIVAIVQLSIAGLILYPRSRKAGLIASVPWAIGVWALGEGFGSIATGFAMLPTGAPGAALLYAAVAVILAMNLNSPLSSRNRFILDLRRAWSFIWILGAIFQVTTRVPLSLMLRANFNELANGEPAMLGTIDRHVATFTASHALVSTLFLVVLEIAVACAPWLTPSYSALSVALGVIVIFWVVGENFGGLLSGSANDPGLSPVLALLAVGCFRSQDSVFKTKRHLLPSVIPGQIDNCLD